MKPITLAGFEDKFGADSDPWGTFSGADEALKRRAILHAMGSAPWGRVLELGAGNGSNSAAIAPRALRLDATEATAEGTRLIARAIAPAGQRARAIRLVVPGRLPRARYDIIVVAELLYYLSPRDMAETARAVAGALRPGGRLVLGHHRVDFHDFAQHAHAIHARFLAATGRAVTARVVRRTGRWVVLACGLGDHPREGQRVAPVDAA